MIDIESLPVEHASDPFWRLDNLYHVRDVSGQVVPFKLLPVQRKLLESMWYFNLILKSRQHGISTLVDLMLLDVALFIPNQSCVIVADTEDKAKKLFEEKIMLPYQNLPEGFRKARYTETENTQGLEFDNGSTITVGTTVRGLTIQWLHISELGPICKREPLKAHEIKTGAFNTVHPGQHMFVESTSVGAEGLFYEMCQEARKPMLEGKQLTRLGWKLHFFGWFEDPRNRMADHEVDLVTIGPVERKYFETLEKTQNVILDQAQKAWYVAKKDTQGEDMMHEHPSTIDEAFHVSTEGRIFGLQMQKVRSQQRLRTVPWVPTEVVNTFWDLGHSDATAIWFHQHLLGEHRFIHYYENTGEDISHYVAYCRAKGYVFGKWYLPHDASSKRVNETKSCEQRMVDLGVMRSDIVVVPRVSDKWVSINLARSTLPMCWFDADGTKRGVWCLDHYEKVWSKAAGKYIDEPAHNEASNGADAFQQFPMGWKLKTVTHGAPRLPSPVMDAEIGY